LSFAQEAETSGCQKGAELNVLKPNDAKGFEDFISKTCEQPKFFNSEENTREIDRIHDKQYCENISTCANEKSVKAASDLAKKYFKEHLDEVVFTAQFNRTIKKNKDICGVVKPTAACEDLIRKTFKVEGNESVSAFVTRKFIQKGNKDSGTCKNKLVLTNICSIQESRVADIKRCESIKGDDCLAYEQFAFRTYLNSLLEVDDVKNKIDRKN